MVMVTWRNIQNVSQTLCCRTAAVRFSLALTKRPISRNSPRWAAAKVPDLHMSLTAMARVPPMVPPMVHMVDLMDMDRQMQATCQEDRDLVHFEAKCGTGTGADI